MADIELVIKIPKEEYDLIVNDEACGLNILTRAIANGTPLPKGHGRLIDYGYVVDAIDDWVNAGEYNYTNATDYLRNRIRIAPTIIEADKESEMRDADS